MTALPITYEDPEPEKKSWFSAATWSEVQTQLYLLKDITVIHATYLLRSERPSVPGIDA
jgi:hypothetical protein